MNLLKHLSRLTKNLERLSESLTITRLSKVNTLFILKLHKMSRIEFTKHLVTSFVDVKINLAEKKVFLGLRVELIV